MRRSSRTRGTSSSRWARSPSPSGCSGRFRSGFDGCEPPRRCRDDRDEGRDSRRTRTQRGCSAPTGNERPCAGRSGRQHAPMATQRPVTGVRKDLAHLRNMQYNRRIGPRSRRARMGPGYPGNPGFRIRQCEYLERTSSMQFA